MARISVPPNMTNESKKEASTDADTSLRKKSQKKRSRFFLRKRN